MKSTVLVVVVVWELLMAVQGQGEDIAWRVREGCAVCIITSCRGRDRTLDLGGLIV